MSFIDHLIELIWVAAQTCGIIASSNLWYIAGSNLWYKQEASNQNFQIWSNLQKVWILNAHCTKTIRQLDPWNLDSYENGLWKPGFYLWNHNKRQLRLTCRFPNLSKKYTHIILYSYLAYDNIPQWRHANFLMFP